MEALPSSIVAFRDTEMKKSVFAKLLDTILITWMGVDEIARRKLSRVGAELRAYIKAKEQEEMKGRGDIFAALYSKCEGVQDFRGMFSAINQLCRRTGFEPSVDLATSLGEFLESKELDSEWRENDNLELGFNEDDLCLIFRYELLTLRTLDAIAERLVEQSPTDFGSRDLIANLRKLAYEQAKELATFAINTPQLYEEIGTDRFCPDPAVRKFWSEVGWERESRKAHPIDRRTDTEPAFVNALKVFNASLKTHAKVGFMPVLDRCAARELHNQISYCVALWEKAMGEHYHLGPTLGLLDWTRIVNAAMLDWLDSSETKLKGETGECYRSRVRRTVENYRKAEGPLRKVLMHGIA